MKKNVIKYSTTGFWNTIEPGYAVYMNKGDNQLQLLIFKQYN